eukprot:319344_1
MSSVQSSVWIIYCLFSVSSYVYAQNITGLIETFGQQLESLMCDGLRIGGDKCSNGKYGIQNFIYSFEEHFESDASDVSELAQSIIARLDQTLNQRAIFLRNLSAVIQSECGHRFGDHETDESLTAYPSLYFAGNDDRNAYLPNDMHLNPVYGDTVSLSASTFKVPNGVDENNENVQKDAQISQLLETTMLDLHDEYCVDTDGNEEYCSMYLGTINGVFRIYPGVQNSLTDSGDYADYDPRFRPWYVSAATGSKAVVILLDISNSMRHNDGFRIVLAKQAVISVLNTLGSSSFVNVVAFSDTLELSCFETSLVPATGRNVAELVRFVTDLQPKGLTNFTIAFNAAFDILKSAENCHTAILFLTDGIADDVSGLIEARNTVDIDAVVFSFTLGDEADATVPRKVAELTNGIYTHIDDEDENLITAMSSYYLYYAYGGSARGDEDIILTSPYLDFDTKTAMITMAMPIYLNDTYFMGVVGCDIPLHFLSDAIGDITIGRKSYSFVMNQESELILHPLIPDGDQLFDSNQEYKAIFVNDVEPQQFSTSVLNNMLKREDGAKRIEASVKQPAGNVNYNGYIHETAELLYIYGGVGPSSLSIAIVIYSESDVDAPMAPAFGMVSSPVDDCNTGLDYVRNASDLSQCSSPFNVFHRFDVMFECESEWIQDAEIFNGSDPSHYNAFYEGQLYSTAYPIYFLQSGLFEHQSDALYIDPTCDELTQLHTLTNRAGTFDSGDLPFGGIREEIGGNILNSIYTLSSLHEFWKPSFLANDSLFVSMWFGHYQGLHISYPGKQFKNTYNNQLRPWYQRAMSYPDLMVWLTPYKHATTGKLVTGANSVMYAPNSEYAFGVAGFNYEYTAFVDYFKSVMGSVCDVASKQYCFIIDSSGFCLYYEGMEKDVEDDDISTKFFGDLEPTLMQSLLDRAFFVNDTNVNFQDDTIDITYIVDENAYNADFSTQATSFGDNNGEYTVHAVYKTNLFVIQINDYHITDIYPNDCPDHVACPGVVSPGCVTKGVECASATIDVCIEPDTTVSADTSVDCPRLNQLGICALENEEESDMCASDFIGIQCEDESTPKDNDVMLVVVIVVVVACCGVVVMIVIIFMCCKKKSKTNDDDSTQPNELPNVYPNLEKDEIEMNQDNKWHTKPSAPYNPEYYKDERSP